MTCIVPSSTTCRKGTHRTMVPFLPSFPPRYMLRNTIKNYSCFFFPREKNIFILDFNPLKRGSLRVEPFVVCRNSFFPCFSSFFLGQQFCFSGLLSCPFHCNLSLPCPVYSRSLESTVGKCHLWSNYLGGYSDLSIPSAAQEIQRWCAKSLILRPPFALLEIFYFSDLQICREMCSLPCCNLPTPPFFLWSERRIYMGLYASS